MRDPDGCRRQVQVSGTADSSWQHDTNTLGFFLCLSFFFLVCREVVGVVRKKTMFVYARGSLSSCHFRHIDCRMRRRLLATQRRPGAAHTGGCASVVVVVWWFGLARVRYIKKFNTETTKLAGYSGIYILRKSILEPTHSGNLSGCKIIEFDYSYVFQTLNK